MRQGIRPSPPPSPRKRGEGATTRNIPSPRFSGEREGPALAGEPAPDLIRG